MIAVRDYSQEQVDAWAPASVDRDRWRVRMEGINPFVVEHDHQIVGYADVQTTGYIDHFFVSGHHPAQGIGSRLMTTLQEQAKRSGIWELTSHVSRTAQPFFARFGFVVVECCCSDGPPIGIAQHRARLRAGDLAVKVETTLKSRAGQ